MVSLSQKGLLKEIVKKAIYCSIQKKLLDMHNKYFHQKKIQVEENTLQIYSKKILKEFIFRIINLKSFQQTYTNVNRHEVFL